MHTRHQVLKAHHEETRGGTALVARCRAPQDGPRDAIRGLPQRRLRLARAREPAGGAGAPPTAAQGHVPLGRHRQGHSAGGLRSGQRQGHGGDLPTECERAERLGEDWGRRGGRFWP